jgi:hypothetical protein
MKDMFEISSRVVCINLDLAGYFAYSTLVQYRKEWSRGHERYIDRSFEFEEYMMGIVDPVGSGFAYRALDGQLRTGFNAVSCPGETDSRDYNYSALKGNWRIGTYGP